MKTETIVIPTPFKKSFERAAYTLTCYPFNRNISIVESRKIDEYTNYSIEYEREGDLFNLGIVYNDLNSSEDKLKKLKPYYNKTRINNEHFNRINMNEADKHFHDFVEDRFRGKILVKDYGDRDYGKFVEIIDNGDNGDLIRIATIGWGFLSERLLQLRDVEKQYTPYTREELEAEIKEDLDKLESSTLGELTKEKAKKLTDDEEYIFY